MVDRLKNAIEDLEPPTCPGCNLGMRWYRSVLIRDSDPAAIAHSFQCPRCNRILETRSLVEAAGGAIDPSKLSKPRQTGWIGRRAALQHR
jgi:hypothetical protein